MQQGFCRDRGNGRVYMPGTSGGFLSTPGKGFPALPTWSYSKNRSQSRALHPPTWENTSVSAKHPSPACISDPTRFSGVKHALLEQDDLAFSPAGVPSPRCDAVRDGLELCPLSGWLEASSYNTSGFGACNSARPQVPKLQFSAQGVCFCREGDACSKLRGDETAGRRSSFFSPCALVAFTFRLLLSVSQGLSKHRPSPCTR